MDPRHAILFEPLQIGPKVLRNRFYQVPHCSGFGVVKPSTQAAHRGVKAEGGWAAVCTEYAPISPDSDEGPYIGADFWDDEHMRRLAAMVEQAHAHGALAGIELHHAGAHASTTTTRHVAIAPSQLQCDSVPEITPKAMEHSDIRRVQADWVRAARRARDGGFDIVYVYGAHSFLPMQFLSPFYNRRSDEYGGSLVNRARFWLETLEVVREAIGDDCAIASRIAVDALGPAGIELDEALAFIGMADALVDLWDVNIGSISEWSKDSGSSRWFAEGWQLEWTGQVRSVTAKPIVGVGRLSSPDRMAEIVRSGVWDIVGAARQSIADPFLPQKVQEGRLDEIRECTGSNVCIAKYMTAFHIGCIQNATVGEEHRRGWHPERFEPAANARSDVLVVGAGPAGLECAIVLARRGFKRVHVVDGASEVGGQMRWVPNLPGLGEWGRVLNYRQIQLRKLRRQIELHTGVHLDADAIADYGADIVILATGAHWSSAGLSFVNREPIVGADASLPHVLTPEQVMLEGKHPPGRRVVVYDCDGYFVGPGIAELLAGEGYAVSIVTPHEVVSPFSTHTLEGPLLRRHLHAAGIAMHRGVTLDALAPDGVSGSDEFDEPFALATDAVVLVTQRLSNDGLYHELAAAAIGALHRIGDCVAPRLIADVIFDGHRLAREIDSPDPAVPLALRSE